MEDEVDAAEIKKRKTDRRTDRHRLTERQTVREEEGERRPKQNNK